MKKAFLLNAPITNVISRLGHTDAMGVCDAGLPIPDGVERIDLAVTKGLPSFLDVFQAITSEMHVERALLAEELKKQQPDYHASLVTAIEKLGKAQGNIIAIDYVPHERFKQESHACKAIVRTGEVTPYANILLYAGVTFS